MRIPKVFKSKTRRHRKAQPEPDEPEPDEPEPDEPGPATQVPKLTPHDFALLGLRFDRTQTLRKGAAKAPQMLRKVLPKLETYVYGVDLSASSLEDLGDVKAKSFKELAKQTAVKLASTKKFPIIIGGEHTVSLAAVKALKPDAVVILDAHPDCEASEKHDGVTRKIAELVGPENVFIYGARVASAAEDEYLGSSGVNVVDSLNRLQWVRGRVYLSIDFDVLDPSIIGSVGNPEPMGLSFSEVTQAIKLVAPHLIAADFVEFTPTASGEKDIHALMAGKLIYSTMAAIVKARQK